MFHLHSAGLTSPWSCDQAPLMGGAPTATLATPTETVVVTGPAGRPGYHWFHSLSACPASFSTPSTWDKPGWITCCTDAGACSVTGVSRDSLQLVIKVVPALLIHWPWAGRAVCAGLARPAHRLQYTAERPWLRPESSTVQPSWMASGRGFTRPCPTPVTASLHLPPSPFTALLHGPRCGPGRRRPRCPGCT